MAAVAGDGDNADVPIVELKQQERKLPNQVDVCFKILSPTLEHNGYRYKGRHMNVLPDNEKFDGTTCGPGGLHSTQQPWAWVHFGTKMAKCSIPGDAQVAFFDAYNKIKSDKLWIESIEPIPVEVYREAFRRYGHGILVPYIYQTAEFKQAESEFLKAYERLHPGVLAAQRAEERKQAAEEERKQAAEEERKQSCCYNKPHKTRHSA